MAIAPEVEFRNPSLMVSPDVSTQLSAPALAVSLSLDFEPQLLRTRAAASNAAELASRRGRESVTDETSRGVDRQAHDVVNHLRQDARERRFRVTTEWN
jgi:hypothetical protein